MRNKKGESDATLSPIPQLLIQSYEKNLFTARFGPVY